MNIVKSHLLKDFNFILKQKILSAYLFSSSPQTLNERYPSISNDKTMMDVRNGYQFQIKIWGFNPRENWKTVVLSLRFWYIVYPISHQHKLMHTFWVEYFKSQFWTVYCCFKISYWGAHDLKVELMVLIHVMGLEKRTTITRISVISKNDFRLSQNVSVSVAFIRVWRDFRFDLLILK